MFPILPTDVDYKNTGKKNLQEIATKQDFSAAD